MATNETQDGEETQTTEDPGGSYEVLRNRLAEQGRELAKKTEALNKKRKEKFGSSELTVVGNVRVRTENNCIPAEIISVGEHLVFGYTVHMGLKTQAEVSDAFSLHKFEQTDDGFEFPEVPVDEAPGLLQDRVFVRELEELHQYYKDPYLLQLKATSDGKLLAVFRVGERVEDVKVFTWSIDQKGRATYIDNRGEKLYFESFPPSHDFRWLPTSRDMHVPGRFPHVSLEDECFVETIGGDLTIKIEDNTEDGLGVYREPVQEADQSLDDAQFFYARVGALILIKVLPYREEEWRHFVFNTKTKEAVRIDMIGKACVQLPEDHGIIFPGGYYLQTGAFKVFDEDPGDLEFQQAVKSPNGEDVLYVFLTREDGTYLLLPYNLINKEVLNPIHCHGYTLFEDGKLVIFRSATDEATRVHPMQIWQTQFTTQEYAASAPTDDSFLSKVGNADLVRGISDAFSIRRLCENSTPTRHIYEDIARSSTRMLDSYYWLPDKEVGGLDEDVKTVRKTAELIIDEFEKVQALQKQARESLREARSKQQEIIRDLRPDDWHEIERFMKALGELRHQRGRLITLRELRFMDLPAVDELEQEAIEAFDNVSLGCGKFLQTDEAFIPLNEKLATTLAQIDEIEKTFETIPILEDLDRTSEGLDVLSEVSAGLQLDDPTARTHILENISEVFSQLNRVRATLELRRKELLGVEGRAEFAAQFKLLGQSVDSALARADTPDACDELLSQLMLQLEEIEGKFSEFDEYLGELAEKREEIYEAFSGRKQTLVEERQRRAQNMMSAANRILKGAARRAKSFKSADDLNAYYSSDPMLLKLRDLIKKLVELGDSVKSDELESKLKSARQDALRVLRDRTELFEEGENIIKFGRHRFSVNTQPLELTMLPYEGGMGFHLTGTDFYEPVENDDFLHTQDLWDQSLVSENKDVYRGEYLAASIIFDAEQEKKGLSIDKLQDALLEGKLLEVVRTFAADRYDEGYDRGVHDSDAVTILDKLLQIRSTVGLLRFAPTPRALACLFWAIYDDESQRETWQRKGQSLNRLRSSFQFSPAIIDLATELGEAIEKFNHEAGVPCSEADYRVAGQYLAEELMAHEEVVFTTSAEAVSLKDKLLKKLEFIRARSDFLADLEKLDAQPSQAFDVAYAWIDAFVTGTEDKKIAELGHVRTEAAVILITERRLQRAVSSALSSIDATGLLGQHSRIDNGVLKVRLDEFLDRLGDFVHTVVPRYREYRKMRSDLVDEARVKLRLEEFKPRVLTTFVRNKLINEVYLPLIGDNLAKQLGTVGETKRTDLMGLLLLISPPGYGKTTLMEYLASQLGLVFMKVNGPSLGHEVVSLDPADAPNATAAQEVNKINLALEMGNNVLLYLDDIQHTNPELLQKFISLCDAQRRIEGIWNGRTRTYDMRGKKFCMCMAGNPYTESGDRFQIPDMLSNRADTYNLGDILEGKDDAFSLSYIENALTSNTTLAPLASKAQKDLYLLIRMSKGEEIPPTDLSHPYSATELNDYQAVLKHMNVVQETVLAVNQQYIASAAQDDAFRTEPSFQLQGSYRNMNKLAEKVVPALIEDELQRLVDDHYLGEAQTLTSGAEWNLLKLRELRGVLTEEEEARVNEIRDGYQRQKRLGGAEDDPTVRAVSQLNDIGEMLRRIGTGLDSMQEYTQESNLGSKLDGIRDGLQGIQVVEQLGDNLGAKLEDLNKGLHVMASLSQKADVGKRLDGINAGLQGMQAVGQLGDNIGAKLDDLNKGLHIMATLSQQANVGKRLDNISTGLEGMQAVSQLGDNLGAKLDTIGKGLTNLQTINQQTNLGKRLDNLYAGIHALQKHSQQADIGKRLDNISAGLQGVQAAEKAQGADLGKRLDTIGTGLQGMQSINQLGAVLAQRLDNINKGLQGMQAVNQLAAVLAQRLDGINAGLQGMQGVNQLGDNLGTKLDGIGHTLREVAARKPEPTPTEQSLAETASRLQETIEKLQRPQLEVKLDTAVPETMSEMLKQQVALAENVMKLVFTLTRTFEEGGSIHVQLGAALNDMRSITHKLLRAKSPRSSGATQPAARTSATATVKEPEVEVMPYSPPKAAERTPAQPRPRQQTPAPQARPQPQQQQRRVQPQQQRTPAPQARPQPQPRQPRQTPAPQWAPAQQQQQRQRHTPPPAARPQPQQPRQPPRTPPPQARPQQPSRQPRRTPPPQVRPGTPQQPATPQRPRAPASTATQPGLPRPGTQPGSPGRSSDDEGGSGGSSR